MVKRYKKPLTSVVVIILMISITLVFLGAEDVSANEIELEKDVIENSTLSSQNRRTPAEWETTEKVLYLPHEDYSDYFDSLTTVLDELSITRENVTYVFDDENVTLEEVHMWIRDFGPITEMNEGVPRYINLRYENLFEPILHPRDRFTEWYGGNKTLTNYYLSSHGGNFMIDSAGLFYESGGTLSGNLIYYEDEQVVTDLMKSFFNIHEYNVAGGYTINGHIDMFAKLVSENTVIIAEAIDGYQVPNGGTALSPTDADILGDVANYFESSSPRNGEGYQIYRVPAWEQDGALVSYTNSLIINDNVIIPEYNYDWADNYDWDDYVTGKGGIYYNAMPDHNRETVDSSDVIQLGGAVHCTTMQIPKRNMPPEITNVDVDITYEDFD